MVTSDLGACEWFVWDLRRSGLIDRGHLDQVVGEFLKKSPRAEPQALAQYLVSQDILSAFQSERILQGKTQGLVLGPYVLVDTIGSGSMGQVYKAVSKTDNLLYAVKVLPRRSMWNVRLARRQVRSFGQFTHPAVVPFVDVGTSGGLHYLVWPLVEGETLENLVQREGKLTPEQTALIGLQIAQGLNLCHQNGLFHGLLKPSNILIGSDGQTRVLDFGIGSLLVENEGESLVDTMSASNTLTSGLDCASPESIMEPTNRTPAGDQYSLGCTLYYCLSGRYPFPEGSAVEKMMAHQFKQPTAIRELCPDVPEGLLDVIDRLMQKSPDGRYAGADEVVDVLQPYVQQVTPMPPVRGSKSVRPTQPNTPAAPPASPSRVSSTMANFSIDDAPTQMPLAPPPPPMYAGASPPAPTAPAQRPTVPTVPNRGIFQNSTSQSPAPPVAQPQPVPPPAVPTQPTLSSNPPGWATGQMPGGWVPEQKESSGGMSQLMLVIVTMALTAGVFFLGRKLFGG